jgi:hypothetical protein
MRSPSLRELPPPPAGKLGWPWTDETALAAVANQGASCRVSIVTPSFNQGRFLEETIRSVLLQGYPDLEYVVIDGGSTDESIEIIRKYEDWLTFWVSEKDSGQADAINKGFSHTTGEICAYLNSDDVFLPGALCNVNFFFEKNPEAAVAYGDCQIIDESSAVNDLWISPEFHLTELFFRCYIAQPATFWRRSKTSSVGEFNAAMHYAFDYQMWLRMAAAGLLFSRVPLTLAQHRKADGTKTVSRPEAFTAEIISSLENFFRSSTSAAALKSLEADAYAIASLNHALLNFRLGNCDEAQNALNETFRFSSDLIARQRERVIRAIVDNADPSGALDRAREYLQLVFTNLSANACALEQLRPSISRRVEILHSARCKDHRSLSNAARLLLLTLINDTAWMRNRAARGEFLKVLIGRSNIQRLSGFKQLLRTVRGTLLHTRKNYG